MLIEYMHQLESIIEKDEYDLSNYQCLIFLPKKRESLDNRLPRNSNTLNNKPNKTRKSLKKKK